MTDAFVLGGVRTPVGRYGGSLSHLRTDDLLGQTMAWACERVEVPLERIEDITAGCVNGPRGDGGRRALGGAGGGLSGLSPGDHRQPLLRLLAVWGDLHCTRDSLRRAGRRPRRRGRVDVALGLGLHEGRGAVHAARAGAAAGHDVAGAGGPPNPNLLPATPT